MDSLPEGGGLNVVTDDGSIPGCVPARQSGSRGFHRPRARLSDQPSGDA